MRTEDLIIALASDARPVRVLRPPAVRLVSWMAIAAVACPTVAIAIGLRPDVAAMLASVPLASELALGALTIVTAAWAAFLSSVPGARGARAFRVAAVAAVGVWMVAVALRLVSGGAPLETLLGEPAHWACPWRIVAAALVPSAAAWWMIRRAAPLDPAWSAGLAALAALAAGAVAVPFMCPIHCAAHMLLWHMGPVAVLALVAAGVAAVRAQRP